MVQRARNGVHGTVSMEMYVRMAVQCLKTGLQNVDEEQEESRIIRFVMEQLQLAITNKFCRHYSPQLTVFCYMLQAASSELVCVFVYTRRENSVRTFCEYFAQSVTPPVRC